MTTTELAELASLPEIVKGFGHVKEQNVIAMGKRKKLLMQQFENESAALPAGAALKVVAAG